MLYDCVLRSDVKLTTLLIWSRVSSMLTQQTMYTYRPLCFCFAVDRFDQFKLKFTKKNTPPSHDAAAQYTLLDVFKNSTLRLYALIMCLLW